jgi:hypothetical protein
MIVSGVKVGSLFPTFEDSFSASSTLLRISGSPQMYRRTARAKNPKKPVSFWASRAKV